MPFYVATSDSTGAKITVSEVLLSPGPTRVEYPNAKAGTEVVTSDGVVIIQQPSKDPRKRAWIWANYPAWFPAYQPLYDKLYPLRARVRRDYGAATPFVWVKDTETQLLKLRVLVTGVVSSGGSNTLTVAGTPWTPSAYIGMDVEVVDGTAKGQVRRITANTSSQLTVSTNWTTNPVAADTFVIRGLSDSWWKVRVVSVERTLREDTSLVTYATTRMEFVIEDAAWTDLG